MSEIDVFQFPTTGQQVRAVVLDGEPWFGAVDVCAVLGLDRHRDVMSGLDDDEKTRDSIAGTLVDLISEAGLYSVILRSRKPEAKAFKRWVTHDVLPAIRQTGRYEAAPARPMSELEMAQRYVAALEREENLKAQVAELEPDAARARRMLDANGLSLVGTVAKRFGIKERALRDFLYSERLIIRGGSRHNEPYASYVQSGHFEVKVRLVGDDMDRAPIEKSTTFVTPKGEALIWRRLHAAGYVSSPKMPDPQLVLI